LFWKHKYSTYTCIVPFHFYIPSVFFRLELEKLKAFAYTVRHTVRILDFAFKTQKNPNQNSLLMYSKETKWYTYEEIMTVKKSWLSPSVPVCISDIQHGRSCCK
jgi:hypothetical protein